MKFYIDRTWSTGSMPPIPEASFEEYLVDSMLNPGVVEIHKRWFVNFQSLEELYAMTQKLFSENKNMEGVILRNEEIDGQLVPFLEIYDDYRE